MFKLLQINQEIAAISSTVSKLKDLVPVTILSETEQNQYLQCTKIKLFKSNSVLKALRLIMQQTQEKMGLQRMQADSTRQHMLDELVQTTLTVATSSLPLSPFENEF